MSIVSAATSPRNTGTYDAVEASKLTTKAKGGTTKYVIVVCFSVVATLLLIPKQTPPVSPKHLYIQAEQTSKVKSVPELAKPAVAAVEAPTVVPSPTPVPVTGCEAYRPLIQQYSWNVSVAMQVMNAESGCDPAEDSVYDAHPTCYGSRGLFQIGCDSTDDYQGMFNPATNVAQAYALYSHRGWEPWGSTTCKYKVKCY